jgi:CRP-like cAMP-binding protein
MADNDTITTLRDSSLGEELSPEECAVLANIVTRRTLTGEEILIEEGLTDHSLYLVIDGALAVCKKAAGGEWISLHVLNPGDMAGELGFIDGQPHSATLRSIGITEVFILERGAFEALVDSQPWLAYRVMRAILRTVHAILRRMNLQYIELSNYISRQHGKY